MPAFADADLGPEADWVAADPLAELPSVQNFVHTKDPDRIRIQYYCVPEGTALYAKVIFGSGAEGPPMHAHGGALMAVLDEIAGGACWVNGYRVVLANFNANMRQSVPLDTVLIATGDIISVEGRKVMATGLIRGLDGRVYTDATGLFIRLTDAQTSRFNLTPPPERPPK